ncbi:hypothetical protein D3C76_1465360 [compost metagenome]
MRLAAEQGGIGDLVLFQPALQLWRIHLLVITRARQHQQVAEVQQVLPAMPFVQAQQRILANNKRQRRCGATFFTNRFESLDGVRRGGAVQFTIVHGKQWVTGDGQLDHG